MSRVCDPVSCVYLASRVTNPCIYHAPCLMTLACIYHVSWVLVRSWPLHLSCVLHLGSWALQWSDLVSGVLHFHLSCILNFVSCFLRLVHWAFCLSCVVNICCVLCSIVYIMSLTWLGGVLCCCVSCIFYPVSRVVSCRAFSSFSSIVSYRISCCLPPFSLRYIPRMTLRVIFQVVLASKQLLCDGVYAIVLSDSLWYRVKLYDVTINNISLYDTSRPQWQTFSRQRKKKKKKKADSFHLVSSQRVQMRRPAYQRNPLVLAKS